MAQLLDGKAMAAALAEGQKQRVDALKKLGVNTEEFGLLLSIAIQFIPVLQEEGRMVIRAHGE